jgi:hypothetical protein
VVGDGADRVWAFEELQYFLQTLRVRAANGLNPARQILDRSLMAAQAETHAFGPALQGVQRAQIVFQAGGEGKHFGRLVRGDIVQDVVAAEQNIVQPDGHVAGAVARNMQQLEWSEAHPAGFIRKIHINRMEEPLGQGIETQIIRYALRRDARFLQKSFQAARNDRQPFLIIG